MEKIVGFVSVMPYIKQECLVLIWSKLFVIFKDVLDTISIKDGFTISTSHRKLRYLGHLSLKIGEEFDCIIS